MIHPGDLDGQDYPGLVAGETCLMTGRSHVLAVVASVHKGAPDVKGQ